jgi:branched-chain amino acid transport system ATP-binding protein
MATPGRLVVQKLQAGYGSLQAVSDFSIEVTSGEIVGLIGRNGAGKTTSLLAVAGLRYGRSSGEVHLDDKALSTKSPDEIVAAGLAHVPEGHRVFSSMTVRENLMLGAYCRRSAPSAEIAASLQTVFELFPILKTYESRPVGFLSGGEQQMVAIGQALMAEPKVLMLDEPTSGLALVIIRQILEVLRELKSRGMGILVVEQSIARAFDLCDRLYVMEQGRIVMSGDAGDLRTDDRVTSIVRGVAAVNHQTNE